MRAGRWALDEDDGSVDVEDGGEDGLLCILDLNVILGTAGATGFKTDLMYLAWSRVTSCRRSKQAGEVICSGQIIKYRNSWVP